MPTRKTAKTPNWPRTPHQPARLMKALLALKGRFQHLDEISCPTIVIGGSEDRRTTPAAHEVLAREIPGSSLVMIADAAHFTMLEQPRKVSEALQRWMTDLANA